MPYASRFQSAVGGSDRSVMGSSGGGGGFEAPASATTTSRTASGASSGVLGGPTALAAAPSASVSLEMGGLGVRSAWLAGDAARVFQKFLDLPQYQRPRVSSASSLPSRTTAGSSSSSDVDNKRCAEAGHAHLLTGYLDLLWGRRGRMLLIENCPPLSATLANRLKSSRLSTGGPGFDLREAATILDQVASGLAFLHRSGVVHGALCTDSVYVSDHRGPAAASNTSSSKRCPRILIGDWAASHVFSDSCRDGGHFSCPAFADPAVSGLGGCKSLPVTEARSPSSDIWSLGLIAVDLLCTDVHAFCVNPAGEPGSDSLRGFVVSLLRTWTDEPPGGIGAPPDVAITEAIRIFLQDQLTLLDWSSLGQDQEHSQDQLLQLLTACLAPNPSNRPTSSDISRSPWIRENSEFHEATAWADAVRLQQRAEADMRAEQARSRMLRRALPDDSKLDSESWYFTKTQALLCDFSETRKIENFLRQRMAVYDREAESQEVASFCEGMYLVCAHSEYRKPDDLDGLTYTFRLSVCRRSGSLSVGHATHSEFTFVHAWIHSSPGLGYTLDPQSVGHVTALRWYGSLGELCNGARLSEGCVPYFPPAQTSGAVSAPSAQSRPEERDLSAENSLMALYSQWRRDAAGDPCTQLLKIAGDAIDETNVRSRHSKLPASRIFRQDVAAEAFERSADAIRLPLGRSFINARVLSVHRAILKIRGSDNPGAGSAVPTAGDPWYEELHRLPLSVREKDVVYQRRRLAAFAWLLRDVALSSGVDLAEARRRLIEEARVDIPWMARGPIWQATLHVPDHEARTIWMQATLTKDGRHDPDSPSDADKQIELDLPRCHAYNSTINSPFGKRLMRRVLKAWVRYNDGKLVYWQGLDSVAAPFVVLFAGTPPRPSDSTGLPGVIADLDAAESSAARALGCLQKFVDKYLHNYFLADNHEQLQGHLTIFSQLLAYHDPKLASHLFVHEFQPDLYAIPWFLTMFMHVLKLQQCFPLWDTLIVGPSELPLFVGVGVLKQFGASILRLKDFNQILEMFTALPTVDVQQLVEEMQIMFNQTPWTGTLNEYAMHRREDQSGPTNPDQALPDKISLETLRQELAPRMLVRDLVEFLDQLVVVDFRLSKPFAALHLVGAMNFPLKPATLAAEVELEMFSELRGQHIVLCDEDSILTTRRTAEIAARLVKEGYPFVSVLHGGFEHLCAQVSRDLLVEKAR